MIKINDAIDFEHFNSSCFALLLFITKQFKNMKILIEAPWEVNDYTKSVIEDKLQKLNKVSDDIIRADVYLKTGDSFAPNDKIMEVRLHVPGPDIFASANTDSFEKTANEISNKL